jgi:hypothetical protein
MPACGCIMPGILPHSSTATHLVCPKQQQVCVLRLLQGLGLEVQGERVVALILGPLAQEGAAKLQRSVHGNGAGQRRHG